MNKTTILYSSLILIGTFISAISQVMLKKAALKEYDNPLNEYLNPYVIVAYSIFVLSTLLSIVAYREIPLSMGTILETTSYIYITFFGVKIFSEKMNLKKIKTQILLFLILKV